MPTFFGPKILQNRYIDLLNILSLVFLHYQKKDACNFFFNIFSFFWIGRHFFLTSEFKSFWESSDQTNLQKVRFPTH